ncbi:carotenoid biosynthesis protein [Salimicrobium halophilum]|uniref:Putative membrane protein n=1 Tax=Salimicrobium halophilum TaxID=86666 RepID=A0A1G8RNR8_9BACI|nr:carotenoid biosynthesis protein [Salimicrobium halophilum]SDJ18552.1 putative membrane protein [Salimicrobium halophilum]
MGDKIFYFFCGWFIIGFILVPLDLVPPWLEWANSVFLIVAGVVAVFYFLHTYGTKIGYLYSIFVFIVSIAVEQYGVQSGLFFGSYEYTSRFGIKIFDTPVTIGFAWLLVMGCADVLARGITSSRLFLPVLGASVAVTMDLILDPVAFKVKEYWIWTEGGYYYDIPTQNFIGWFILAFLFQASISFASTRFQKVWQTRMSLVFLGMILMFSVTAIFGGLIAAPILVLILSTGWYVLFLKRRRLYATDR